jgi:hypothetical protein
MPAGTPVKPRAHSRMRLRRVCCTLTAPAPATRHGPCGGVPAALHHPGRRSPRNPWASWATKAHVRNAPGTVLLAVDKRQTLNSTVDKSTADRPGRGHREAHTLPRRGARRAHLRFSSWGASGASSLAWMPPISSSKPPLFAFSSPADRPARTTCLLAGPRNWQRQSAHVREHVDL